jgi:hypothetical protein
MGGIGLSYAIEKTTGGDLLALHRAIWEALRAQLKKRLKTAGFKSIVENYLSDEAHDGLSEGKWTRSDDELSFSFMEHAGTCALSVEACFHWFDMLHAGEHAALDKIARAHGYLLTPVKRPLLEKLRRGPSYPLVDMRSLAYGVVRRKPGKPIIEVDSDGEPIEDTLFTDDGAERVAYSELRPKERALVDVAAMTGHCSCGVCASYQELDLDVAKLADKVHRAWDVLETSRRANGLELVAAKRLKKELSPAVVELPVLGDLLEEKGATLPLELLVGMVVSRERERERQRDYDDE